MTKSELKTGMLLTLRNGYKLVVFKDSKCKFTDGDVFVQTNGSWWSPLSRFNDDLTYKGNEDYDVVSVDIRTFTTDLIHISEHSLNKECIWTRKEEPKVQKLTLEEVEKLLGYPVEIVEDKPHKYKVGDKVVIVSNTSFYFPKGTIAEIEEIDDYDDESPYLCKRNGDEDWFAPDEIKPYKKEEDKPHEYKVGDKVVTTKLRDYGGCEVFPVGTVCTIDHIKSNYNGELPYILKDKTGDWWHYSEDMFEPYKEV